MGHIFGPQTKLIHGQSGKAPEQLQRPHAEPIIETSTFCFESVEEGEKIFSGSTRLDVYSRISNQNHRSLEKRLCLLEDGEAAQVFDSGMSAITTVLLSLLSSGDEVIAHRNIYGGTYGFLNRIKKFDIQTTYVDARYVLNVLDAVTPRTKLIF